MNRRQFLKAVPAGILAATALPCFVNAQKKNRKPNIVVIMADDMGYSDIGCYGGEINTPNLDSLAAGGMRFTQFYNCAKCSPTRASLLTGQYEQAVGIKKMEHGSTFAEVLRAVGYRTIASGKWHQDPLPTTRGFDRYFGLADGRYTFTPPFRAIQYLD
jgi:arylsulfatase